jgi:replicative superfamily II helicase
MRGVSEAVSTGLRFERARPPGDHNPVQDLICADSYRKGLRVLTATTTLAWGVNLPARRVIIAHMHHGPLDRDEGEISTADILQMAGRAGRPQYDREGHAHIVIPSETRTQTDPHGVRGSG